LDKIGFEDHVEETQESHGVYDADQHPAQVKVLALLGQQSGQGKRDEGDEGAGESRQDDGRIDAAYVAEERSQGLSRAEAKGIEHAQSCVVVFAVILVEVQAQDQDQSGHRRQDSEIEEVAHLEQGSHGRGGGSAAQDHVYLGQVLAHIGLTGEKK